MKKRDRFIIMYLLNIVIINLIAITPILFLKDYRFIYYVLFLNGVVLLIQAIYYFKVKQFFKMILDQYTRVDVKELGLFGRINVLKELFINSQDINRRYEKNNRTLYIAIDINNYLLQPHTLQEAYDYILKMAIDSVDHCSKGTIMLVNEKDELEFFSINGFDESFFDVKYHKSEAFLYKLTDGKLDKPAIVDNVIEFNRKYMEDEAFEEFYTKFPKEFQTTLTAPIVADGRFIGVINLDANEKDVFTDEDISIMNLFVTQLELSIKNKTLLDEILYLSRYDKLTTAYNRSYYETFAEDIIKENKPFSYVVIDINDLKKVNDILGHIEGDHLLTHFSDAVRNKLRSNDFFARIGGDEFVLIYPGMSKVEVSKILLQVTKDLEKLVFDLVLPYQISFSYGIASFPEESVDIDTLYIQADEKMYKMKQSFKEQL